MRVIEYCTEEVRRQGHDVYSLDGIERVGWMLNAWSAAIEMAEDGEPLDMIAIRSFGMRVEPYKNSNGYRKVGVRVGSRICPPYTEVRSRLKKLLESRASLSPLDFYREFELIHPFVDGNGRTGKILLNMLNGSLLNPIFPPNDFWGEEIVNP